MPLCNARLREDGLSFHIILSYRRETFLILCTYQSQLLVPAPVEFWFFCFFRNFLATFFFGRIFFLECLFLKKSVKSETRGRRPGNTFEKLRRRSLIIAGRIIRAMNSARTASNPVPAARLQRAPFAGVSVCNLHVVWLSLCPLSFWSSSSIYDFGEFSTQLIC